MTYSSLSTSSLNTPTHKERGEGLLWRIPLDIHRVSGDRGNLQPVSFGVPLPRGCVHEAHTARMVTPEGTFIPVQIQPLCRWIDGSVQWALVDAMLSKEFVDQGALEFLEDEQLNEDLGIVIETKSSGLIIRTGVATFHLNFHGLRPFEKIQFDESGVSPLNGSRIVLRDKKGRLHEAACHDWRIETSGPIRASVCGIGEFSKVRGLRLNLRMSFFAKSGFVKLEVMLHNPHRAKHPGGTWDLGDAGSICFQDLSIEFSPQSSSHFPRLGYSLDPSEKGQTPVDLNSKNWTVYQDSSGGANWQSQNHVDRTGRIPCRFQGYCVRTGDTEAFGRRALPTITWYDEHARVSLAVPEFWQQFPKAISVDQNRIRVGLFPEEWDSLHEMQGGERKTHVIWMDFQSVSQSNQIEESLGWVHHPPIVHPTKDACDHSESLPRIEIAKSTPLAQLDELLITARDGAKGIMANREAVDEYGWRNYGDIFADHEQAYYTGQLPLISHYNNQFDMVYGFLFHYLRTGDRKWWDLGDALARHVTDIDIYHTHEDKPAYNGGLFWFTDHYLHAHTSTHRTYSRTNQPANRDYGGGPSSEHNFTSGLLLHYCLTGNPASCEAVLTLANWVIRMDDGRGTMLGVVDDGPSGLASGSGIYHGPSRMGGNSINALLDAWRLTHASKYLDFAEALLRRCVHPKDDIDTLELLNVEKRWSYTVFLTSLSKYLDLKAEAGLVDDTYSYGQKCLIHYGRWMLANEKPYFDQAENLEFPTEAWAAQEFRKANVFRRAARHASEPLRSDLLRRGEELADRAWEDLLRFPTKTYARAVAILMTEGYADCIYRTSKIESAAQTAPKQDFGIPQEFLPQKLRIKGMIRSPRGVVQTGIRLLNPKRWWSVFQTQTALKQLER